MQQIYTRKSKRCLPNVEFPRSFHLTYTKNYWLNQLKATKHFEKVIFPYLYQIIENMVFPKDQMLLVIMDTFKGQGNDDLRELCANNNCEIVIIPHNLTNKFHPLDLSISTAKEFISEKNTTLGWQMKFQKNSKKA